VWQRLAHFAGHFTNAQYAEEQTRVRALVDREISGGKLPLARYREEWDRLRALVSRR